MVSPTLVRITSSGQLLNASLKNHIYSETFYSVFSCIEVWFTNQNFMRLGIEGIVNFTLIINDSGR